MFGIDFAPGLIMGLREGLEAFLIIAIMLEYLNLIIAESEGEEVYIEQAKFANSAMYQTCCFVKNKDVIIYYIPNTFTPDGDSFNEEFKPQFTAGLDIYDYHMMIFNRWGELVFESYDANFGWDGSFGGMGLVEDGVYIYKIEFGDTMSDKRHYVDGHITVLK